LFIFREKADTNNKTYDMLIKFYTDFISNLWLVCVFFYGLRFEDCWRWTESPCNIV